MTEISRTHRLYEQLRSRIAADRPGTGLPSRSVATPPGDADGSGPLAPMAMVRRMHDAGVTDEKILVGRLIEGLMLEEFGNPAQGANFQFVLSQVVQTLEQDPEAWALCQACIAEATG